MAAVNNAQAGPSKPRANSPSKVDTPSPINMVDELDPEEPRNAAVAGAGGISRNGLSVDENGEVTKVPAFLTKLFSDSDTNELIYWSPKGDSFLIPHQDQLARQILPKYFKHSNFQSFVRQLNMYAFHKVPHNSATPSGEPELWEFINPLFKRGQPDLLGKITRRQRAGGPPIPTISASTSTGSRSSARLQTQVMTPGGSHHPMHLITDGTTQGHVDNTSSSSNSGGNMNMVISPQGMIELSAITSGIAAIQRTQATIGADLKALQASNEHLWREALEQREKHKKHQETIDLIVSFLERLFGTDGEGLKGLKEAMRRTGLARTASSGNTGSGSAGGNEGASVEETGGSARKKRRLGMDRMISDGRGDDGGGVVEISSDKKSRYTDPFLPRPTRTRSNESQWEAANRFTTIPSDGEPSPFDARTPTPNPPHSSGSTPPSISGATSGSTDPYALALAPYYPQSSNNNNINNGFDFGHSASGNGDNGFSFNQGSDYSNSNQNQSASNAATQATSAYNLDPALLQTTIGSLLQSPAAAQMFLQSLKQSSQAQNLQQSSKLSQQQQQQSYPNSQSDPTLALFNPLPNSPLSDNALLANQAELLRSYEDASGVGGDVERMQKGIDDLVRSMGLDVGNQNNGVGEIGNVGQGRNGSGGSSNDLGLDGVGVGVGDTSLDEIFGVNGNRNGGINGAEGGEGSGDPEMDIPEGFDVDQFLQSLQDEQTGV